MVGLYGVAYLDHWRLLPRADWAAVIRVAVWFKGTGTIYGRGLLGYRGGTTGLDGFKLVGMAT